VEVREELQQTQEQEKEKHHDMLLILKIMQKLIQKKNVLLVNIADQPRENF
jgi:hypothetical protein